MAGITGGLPPLPQNVLSAAVGGNVAPPLGKGGGDPFKADVSGGISPVDLLSKLTSITKQPALTQTIPGLGGVTGDPASIFAAATPAPVNMPSSGGMGTFGNSLPGFSNQGNPNAPSAQQAQAIGRQLAARYGWNGGNEWNALNNVAMRESGWNANAVNKSSGAYGIAQALPSAQGHPYALGDAATQIQWMLNYIRSRYGDPANAWQHEETAGWY